MFWMVRNGNVEICSGFRIYAQHKGHQLQGHPKFITQHGFTIAWWLDSSRQRHCGRIDFPESSANKSKKNRNSTKWAPLRLSSYKVYHQQVIHQYSTMMRTYSHFPFSPKRQPRPRQSFLLVVSSDMCERENLDKNECCPANQGLKARKEFVVQRSAVPLSQRTCVPGQHLTRRYTWPREFSGELSEEFHLYRSCESWRKIPEKMPIWGQ